MRRSLVIMLLLMSSACTSTGSQRPSAKASILALESGLTAGDLVAAHYTTLPRCPAATKVCSDPATVTSIKAKSQSAYVAVTLAQGQVDADPTGTAAATQIALSSAISALTAYQQAILELPKATP